MNTQDLASRIVDQITRAVLGSPLLDEPQRSVLVRGVKRKLDRAIAGALVRTQNKHPVKVPAVPSKKATMKQIHLKVYSCLCATKAFTVNGIAADADDFGEQCDRSPDTAEEYGCGDMRFTGIPSTPEVLLKYGIDQATYDEVVKRLDALSFGSCGWCV